MEKCEVVPENLERWGMYSHERKRSQNGRMEQSKAIEYGSQKASPDVLKLRNIYIYTSEQAHVTFQLRSVWTF
jgi:hypothetical protein